MINAKNAKEIRRGIRGAFHLAEIPSGVFHGKEGEDRPGDYKTSPINPRTAQLDRMHPRALYQRAKRGLHLSRQTINRGV